MGTPVSPHLSGITIWPGPAQRFANSDGFGTCTAANELFLPKINIRTNRVFDCLGVTTAGQWVQTNANGIPTLGSTVASAAAAITPTGVYFKVSGTAAITG